MTYMEFFGTDEPTKEMLVALGLMEAEWYRDFPTPDACYLEDLEDGDK